MIMLKDVQLDYEDALDNALVIKRLSNDRQVLKLIDARENFSMDKKALDFIRSVDLKQTLARAVVKGSGLSNLLQNFFAGISKPKVPTKVFSDYDKAYNWLLTMQKKASL
ncbi:MAG: hypothetical protein K0S33_593 [Bacteroidetes bacterium]|nr:hypothetical protein [Bacteroidota bacterium]